MLKPYCSVLVIVLIGILIAFGHTVQAGPIDSPEPVEGQACQMEMGNNTSGQSAAVLALEQVVRNHPVFVESATELKTFQLEEEVIRAASAVMQEHVRVKEKETRGEKTCVTITATLSSAWLEKLIRQRVKAKEIAQAAVAVLPPEHSAGTKVWTNKSHGHYVEGDQLIIYVQSDREVYLKLDYFQADGTVVHLVPNMFGEPGKLKAGKVYEFGRKAASDNFRIQGPFGAEALCATFSDEPFDPAITSVDAVGDSGKYLRLLSAEEGKRAPTRVGPKWYSTAVPLDTVSKKEETYLKERVPVTSIWTPANK